MFGSMDLDLNIQLGTNPDVAGFRSKLPSKDELTFSDDQINSPYIKARNNRIIVRSFDGNLS